MSYQGTATNTLNHYLKTAFTASGLNWDGDNTSEVENVVDCIVMAAVQEVENRQTRDPDKPTGPTPAYVRELEAELLAMKAELVALASKADELVMELTGVDLPEDDPLVDTLPASISMAVYELMELAHLTLAAANEAQS